MAIKDLFRQSKPLSSANLTSASIGLDGPDYLKEHDEYVTRIEPHIDYSDPSNFAFYGLAESYYVDSFNRITSTYPYDGSRTEKLRWHNSSSNFDNFVFDSLYPRRTGYVSFEYDSQASTTTFAGKQYALATTPSYIQTKGVMNTGSYNDSMTKLSKGFKNSNVYDLSLNKTTNLDLNFNNGVTLEFWMKQHSNPYSSSSVIYDLWNGTTSGEEHYGRLTIELTGSYAGASGQFLITAQSGNNGLFQQSIGDFDPTDWSQYSIRLFNSSSLLYVQLYQTGSLVETNASVASLGAITGSLVSNIGAFRASPSSSAPTGLSEGWGGFSGSLDEFRFWKTKRTAQDIGRFWFTQVGGGTNTDKYSSDLGLYYKFNEGITQTSSLDSIVIDYSGRTSNGKWINYNTIGSRNTGSAILSASAASSEFEDPIIFPRNPSVLSAKSYWKNIGINYDVNNNAAIYNTFPFWVIQEDNGELKRLSQILGSYLDTLHVQISKLPTLKNVSFLSGTDKPHPYNKNLLISSGFVAPEIFANADSLAQLYSRNEDQEFEKELFNIKNIIYGNIYTNLVNIYKSKGTEKSFKSILKNFGIDEDLIRINHYADNQTSILQNNYRFISEKKKSINFNRVDNFAASIYQSGSDSSTQKTYIAGSGKSKLEYNIPQTIEASFIMPRKAIKSDPNYILFRYPYITASLFGLHTPITGNLSDYTYETGSVADLQVYAVREQLESRNVKFVAKSDNTDLAMPTLTSSFLFEVYDDEKWTFGYKVYPTGYPNMGIASGSRRGYTCEFYGVATVNDTVVNDFVATGTMSQEDGEYYLSQPKRLWLGAYATNYTGSVIQRTDTQPLFLRYWFDSLERDTIKNHGYNVFSYGNTSPLIDDYVTSGSVNLKNITGLDKLVLNWDFQQVTSSNAQGSFDVVDISSGSSTIQSSYPSPFNTLLGYRHDGVSIGFPSNTTNVVATKYVNTAKLTSPDIVQSSDMIEIKQSDRIELTKETRPIKFYTSFEKSLYQTISEDMLNWFGTIEEFNNLIGDPINRYQMNYRGLDTLKRTFFSRTRDVASFERFYEVYKWFDSAISQMLLELVPASARTSLGVENLIESHIFERNKYWNKLPTLEYKTTIPSTGIRGVNELTYNYVYGSPPYTNKGETSFIWLKTKASRSGSFLTSGDVGVDQSRDGILSASLSKTNRELGTPLNIKIDLNDY